MHYHIRITNTNQKDLVQYLTTQGISAVVGETETGDVAEKEHYHVMFELTKIKKDSFIKTLKSRDLIQKGNGSYMCKIVFDTHEDKGKCASYAVKNGLHFTNHIIYTEQWLALNPYIESKNKKASKAKSNFNGTMIIEWRRHILENPLNSYGIDEQCIEWTVSYLTSKCRIYDITVINRYVNMLLGSTHLKDVQQRIRNRIMNMRE